MLVVGTMDLLLICSWKTWELKECFGAQIPLEMVGGKLVGRIFCNFFFFFF